MRYLPQPRNMGVAAARNRGMREARGRFIAFLDDDDEWLPGKLRQQMELFERAGPDVGLIYTGVETVGPGGCRSRSIPTASGNILKTLFRHNVLHGAAQSAVIRAEVIETVGYFDEKLSAIEDYDYWIRIAEKYSILAVEDVFVRYYDDQPADEHRQRRSRRWQDNVRAREDVFTKHKKLMRQHGVSHLYLLDSMLRVLQHPLGDRGQAAALGLRAIREGPFRRWTYRAVASRLLRKR